MVEEEEKEIMLVAEDQEEERWLGVAQEAQAFITG